MRKKITVVGAGNVGATLAQRIAEGGYADVILVDIIDGLPQGKALDIQESAPILGFDSRITGTLSYDDTAGSDIVVVTSGVPRKPGMSRDDLVNTNAKIISSVTGEIARRSPNCIMIMVANPLDVMTQLALSLSKFPRERVFGMAGVLDTARFRTFLSLELGVSVEDVQAYVLGGHGDTMVPLIRYTAVAGIPIAELLPKEKLDRIVQRARDGGAEIVNLLKTGSAYYAPSAAAAQMVEAVVFDRHKILPCAVYLQGEYGINGLVVGVPVKLGARGIEQVIEIKLTPEEQKALQKSASAVKEMVDILKL